MQQGFGFIVCSHGHNRRSLGIYAHYHPPKVQWQSKSFPITTNKMIRSAWSIYSHETIFSIPVSVPCKPVCTLKLYFGGIVSCFCMNNFDTFTV